MRKFAVFDIDGTIFRSGLYREIVFELVKKEGLPSKFWKELEAKHEAWRKRSHENAFSDFEKSMVDKIDLNLTSIKISDYDEAVGAVMEEQVENVYTFTKNLITSLKRQGYFMLAISGSQIELVEIFAKRYGFDDYIGQTYERGQEFFTGKVLKTHNGKGQFLKKLVAKHRLSWRDSIAVGDSMGDIEMFELVEFPIVFNPDQRLYEKAKGNGWKIVVERKNVIYTLEKGAHGQYELV